MVNKLGTLVVKTTPNYRARPDRPRGKRACPPSELKTPSFRIPRNAYGIVETWVGLVFLLRQFHSQTYSLNDLRTIRRT